MVEAQGAQLNDGTLMMLNKGKKIARKARELDYFLFRLYSHPFLFWQTLNFLKCTTTRLW